MDRRSRRSDTACDEGRRDRAMPRLVATVALLIMLIGAEGRRPAFAADVMCDYKITGNELLLAQRLWSSVRPGMCWWGHVSGVVRKGDYEKVRAFYAANHPILNLFSISSPGGDVDEALKIGRLFRKYLVNIRAPLHLHMAGRLERVLLGRDQPLPCQSASDCVCASACALIWFGGIERSGTVGLHRPTTHDPRFAKLPAAEASDTYKKVLELSCCRFGRHQPKLIASFVRTASG